MRRLLVLAALLLAGCTTTDPGTPSAGDEPPVTKVTSDTSRATSTTAVGRPRTVDVAAVDICQLVGALPLGDYGLDTDRPPVGGESSVFPGSRDCFANGIRSNLGLLVIAVVDQGAGEFAEIANAAVTRADAGGFPLYVLTPPDQKICVGLLDVNDGQMLYFSYAVGSSDAGPVTPQTTLCQRIPEIAAAIAAGV